MLVGRRVGRRQRRGEGGGRHHRRRRRHGGLARRQGAVAPAVAATGAPGQREAEGERRVVVGVTSAAEGKIERPNHALVGWIGVVERGIHFWLPHSNELQAVLVAACYARRPARQHDARSQEMKVRADSPSCAAGYDKVRTPKLHDDGILLDPHEDPPARGFEDRLVRSWSKETDTARTVA